MRNKLLEASLDLTSQLNLPDVLQALVTQAAELTGARYGALGILDHSGEPVMFVFHGIPEEIAAAMPHPPLGVGLLGMIPDEDYTLVNDLQNDPAYTGWPEGHPEMTSLLGVPVRLNHQVFGRLYLTDKEDGFTHDDLHTVRALAMAAGVAISNARVYAIAKNRERWMSVSQNITTTLLEGTDEEEVLRMIVSQVREVADADTCLLILPSVGDTWACELADGELSHELVGVEFPLNGRALTVLREGVGVIVDSLARAKPMRVPQLRAFGPAMYAPMMVRGTGLGVIILLRSIGRPEFDDSDLTMAESLAMQITLALELAAARHAQDLSTLLEERQRIGRDLHDLAIQQLFATGMQIEGARQILETEGRADLVSLMERALESIDDSVRQIRSIVQSLRESDEAVGLVERLRREASIGRTALGFAPSLVVSVDGVNVDDTGEDTSLQELVDARVDADIADDVVAVVREGLSNGARHAHASSVQVSVCVEGSGATGQVCVTVSDDGHGIPEELSRRSGLDNLAARARRHHGKCGLTRNTTGSGSVLTWRVPLT